MSLRKYIMHSFGVAVLLASIFASNLAPVFAQDKAIDDATDESMEMTFTTEEENAAALAELGYSDEEVKIFFEMSHQFEDAYKNGASEDQLQDIFRKYEPLLQTEGNTDDADKVSLKDIFHLLPIFQSLESGAGAKWTVRFCPYTGAFFYIDEKGRLNGRWKFGMCWRLFRRCSVGQYSYEPGFYFLHLAGGNRPGDHSWLAALMQEKG